MTDIMQNALNHLKTAVDVDPWAIEEVERVFTEYDKRKRGVWKDYQDDGFLECPFCEAATSCEDNADELLYCFSCGARLTVPDPLMETADGCMEDKTE